MSRILKGHEALPIEATTTHVTVGAGWESVGQRVDLDLAAFLYGPGPDNGFLEKVYFARRQSSNNSIVAQPDNVSGAGDGDDERITVDLVRLQAGVENVVFTLTSFSGHAFGVVDDCYVRLLTGDSDDDEMGRFDFNEHTSADVTCLTMCVLHRMPEGASTPWILYTLGIPSTTEDSKLFVKEISAELGLLESALDGPASLEDRLAALRMRLEALTAEAAGLSNEVAAAGEPAAEIQARVAALEAEIADLAAQVAALEGTVQGLEGTTKDNEEALSRLEAEAVRLREEQNRLSGRKAELEAALGSGKSVDDLQSDVDAAASKVANLEASVRVLEENHAQASGDQARLQEELSRLQAQQRELEEQTAALTAAVDDADVASLNREVEAVQARVNELTEARTAASAAQDDHAKQQTRLNATLEDLRAQQASLEREIAGLERGFDPDAIAGAEAQVAALESSLASLRDDKADKESRLAETSQRSASLTADVGRVRP